MTDCIKCEREVTDLNRAYLQVVGYIRPKIERKSSSTLVERRNTGKAMCAGCMTQVRYGITDDQERLF